MKQHHILMTLVALMLVPLALGAQSSIVVGKASGSSYDDIGGGLNSYGDYSYHMGLLYRHSYADKGIRTYNLRTGLIYTKYYGGECTNVVYNPDLLLRAGVSQTRSSLVVPLLWESRRVLGKNGVRSNSFFVGPIAAYGLKDEIFCRMVHGGIEYYGIHDCYNSRQSYRHNDGTDYAMAKISSHHHSRLRLGWCIGLSFGLGKHSNIIMSAQKTSSRHLGFIDRDSYINPNAKTVTWGFSYAYAF